MIFARVLRHVCYKQAAKEEYVLVYRCLCKCAHLRSSRTRKQPHLLKQISPPAVRFSPRLWSLFTSASVPPSEPLFLLHSPSVTFHAFLLPFLRFLPDSSSFLSQPSVQSLLSNVSSCHWTKWNVAFPSSCCTLFPSLLLHHRGEFYLLSPACNLTETPNPPLFFHFFTPPCRVSKLIGHLWRLDCLSPVVPLKPLKFTSFITRKVLSTRLHPGIEKLKALW